MAIKTQLFELAEQITTEALGPEFGVSAMDEGVAEDVLHGHFTEHPELELTTLYYGERGAHNIETAHFIDNAEGVDFKINKYIKATEFEDEWWRHVYGRLCRFLGRQNMVAVFPRVVPLDLTSESKFKGKPNPLDDHVRVVDNRSWGRETESHFAA